MHCTLLGFNALHFGHNLVGTLVYSAEMNVHSSQCIKVMFTAMRTQNRKHNGLFITHNVKSTMHTVICTVHSE